jgi:calcineurin-like phosphoesterase family protein
MSDIWFTSDLHYGHANIAGPSVSKWDSGYRDFDSVEHMNDVLCDNINSVVKANDTLFFLGDLAFGGKANIAKARSRINCKSFFVTAGNHDKHLPEFRDLFSGIYKVWAGKLHGRYFYLNHYAHRVWEHSHHGSIHLFGHSHNSLPDDPHSLSMDVGVDTCLFGHKKYTPYHYDEVIHIMDNFKEWKQVDHHGRDTD